MKKTYTKPILNSEQFSFPPKKAGTISAFVRPDYCKVGTCEACGQSSFDGVGMADCKGNGVELSRFVRPPYCTTKTIDCIDCAFACNDVKDCVGNPIKPHYIERVIDEITPILTGFVDDLEDEIEQRRRGPHIVIDTGETPEQARARAREWHEISERQKKREADAGIMFDE